MPDWDEVIRRNAESAPAAQHLRAIVSRVLPDAVLNIYGGAKTGIGLFSIGGANNVICGIQPRPKDCLLFIHHVTPEDSAKLKLEGKGGSNRHVKIANLASIDETEIEHLLRLARERSGL